MCGKMSLCFFWSPLSAIKLFQTNVSVVQFQLNLEIELLRKIYRTRLGIHQRQIRGIGRSKEIKRRDGTPSKHGESVRTEEFQVLRPVMSNGGRKE